MPPLNKAQELQSEIEDILSEEQDYLDNMPENLQYSERYENAETNCENLQAAINSIEEAVCNLGESQY